MNSFDPIVDRLDYLRMKHGLPPLTEFEKQFLRNMHEKRFSRTSNPYTDDGGWREYAGFKSTDRTADYARKTEPESKMIVVDHGKCNAARAIDTSRFEDADMQGFIVWPSKKDKEGFIVGFWSPETLTEFYTRKEKYA